MKDIISDTLNMEPIHEVHTGEILPPEKKQQPIADDDSGKDLKFARENFYDIISKGTDALEEMITIAKQSESARAFDTVSILMKTLLDANKELVALTKPKEQPTPTGETKNITQNLFVGTPADLQKFLEDMNDE